MEKLKTCPKCGRKVMMTQLHEWSLEPAWDCFYCMKRWFIKKDKNDEKN